MDSDLKFEKENCFYVEEVLGSDSLSHRLREMGLVEGATLRVLSRLPLGGPWRIQVGTLTLALRPLEMQRLKLKSRTQSDG